MYFPSTVIIGIIPNENVFETRVENGTFHLGGIEARFMDLLSKILKFKYHLKSPYDGEFGTLHENGSWSGLIGMVQRKEVDIALNLLSITEDRIKAVDFSEPYTLQDVTFIVRKPGILPPTWSLLYPFDIISWISIAVVLAVAPIILICFLKLKISHQKLFLELLGSFSKQPLTIGIRSVRSRLAFNLWWFFALIISMCYSSALLSFITIPLQKEPLKNFAELSQAVRKGTYRCFSLKGSSILSILQTSRQEHLRFLGKIIDDNKWYYNFNKLECLTNSKIRGAVIDNEFKLKLLLGKLDFESYAMSKDILISLNFAVALRKDFCCKSTLNTVISRLRAAGLYAKLEKEEWLRIWISRSKTIFQDIDDSMVLSVSDISGALIFLATGFVVSSIVLTCENIYFYLNLCR
ncbi:glutamate receptor ionotropic, delta-1 [Nephila pilipes]|uniref:Glutamate receptor ionotropic, delta-1 n=1 Tax=Nephila pilipes TaxID=299642 RepID=A0A8X6QN68_NEPPI|nr:glutamate receptor ionotropic, delta-1 [Nephila pilipes]GFU41223.1 glutamate receptor ionotropic, delta-1 [Nephila pilipes]